MNANSSRRNRAAYNFLTPVDFEAIFSKDQFFVELIKTRAFDRLKTIRFLGGIDYLLVRAPNGALGNIRHTRYQHSLGVARLALFYSDACSLNNPDRRLIFAAALLHDVGHAPLSHSLEPVFFQAFGIDHHQATIDIVLGRSPIDRELVNVLRRGEIDLERLLGLIAGEENIFHDFFGSPINFDTVEGILRSQTYATPNAILPSPESVVAAALDRSTIGDRHLVDEFWRLKDLVYREIINSESGVLADFVCQVFAKRQS
jgi:hypothetical protein